MKGYAPAVLIMVILLAILIIPLLIVAWGIDYLVNYNANTR